MEFETYRLDNARLLAEVLAHIPNLKPSDLGDDPQRFLAS